MHVAFWFALIGGVEVLTDDFSISEATPVRDDFEHGTELLDFLLPVVESGSWDDYEVGAVVKVLLPYVSEHCNCLDSLSQSHFICKNPINSLLV